MTRRLNRYQLRRVCHKALSLDHSFSLFMLMIYWTIYYQQ